jgi:hypothetical protein
MAHSIPDRPSHPLPHTASHQLYTNIAKNRHPDFRSQGPGAPLLVFLRTDAGIAVATPLLEVAALARPLQSNLLGSVFTFSLLSR